MLTEVRWSRSFQTSSRIQLKRLGQMRNTSLDTNKTCEYSFRRQWCRSFKRDIRKNLHAILFNKTRRTGDRINTRSGDTDKSWVFIQFQEQKDHRHRVYNYLQQSLLKKCNFNNLLNYWCQNILIQNGRKWSVKQNQKKSWKLFGAFQIILPAHFWIHTSQDGQFWRYSRYCSGNFS